MEKINFPQVISHSDLIDPLHPGRNQISLGELDKLVAQMMAEYDAED